jgi:hypothetical protein
MTEKVLAIEDYENICFKCLEKKKVEKYHIYRNSYGSSFDNQHTMLQICEECKPEGIKQWFDEEPVMDEYYAKYTYETNIIDFVNTLPLEGQELFWNRCNGGACAYQMDSQDWIDDKLGILPDEIYEEYSMYSPRQIKAYKERFPVCEYPVNAKFDDDSFGCYCPFGASGNKDQKVDGNISDECYGCEKFKERKSPIKEMDYDTYKKYEVYIQGQEYKHLFE